MQNRNVAEPRNYESREVLEQEATEPGNTEPETPPSRGEPIR